LGEKREKGFLPRGKKHLPHRKKNVLQKGQEQGEGKGKKNCCRLSLVNEGKGEIWEKDVFKARRGKESEKKKKTPLKSSGQ